MTAVARRPHRPLAEDHPLSREDRPGLLRRLFSRGKPPEPVEGKLFTARSRPAPADAEPAEPLFAARREDPDDEAAAPPEREGGHASDRTTDGTGSEAGEPDAGDPHEDAPHGDVPPASSGGLFDDALFDAPHARDGGTEPPDDLAPGGGEVVVSDIPPAHHPTSDDIAALTSELTRLAAEADERPWDEPVHPADAPTADTPTDGPTSGTGLPADGAGTDAWWELAEPAEPAAHAPATTSKDDAPPATGWEPRPGGGHAEARRQDEPQPWVGHTDDLDRPPPQAPIPHVPVTEHPPAPVHDAHDGSRVTVTGTSDEGHLVVHVEPPAAAQDDTGPNDPAAGPPREEPSPTGVHAAAHERGAEGPRTRVHGERLDNRPGPIRLSPSEAVALAEQGPEALRRERPRSA